MLSPTLEINERSRTLEKAGKTIFKLGFGQSPFPVPEVIVRALQYHAFQKDYLPVMGLLPLREAIAAYYNRIYSLPVQPEQVMVGPGSKTLIFLAQFVTKCTLLLPAPSWVSYAPQASLVGNPVHWISTEITSGWKLSPEILEEACKEVSGPGMLIVNYPSNPTGSSFTRQEMEKLANIARNHNLIIISDEIYGRLHFEEPHTSIATFYPEGTIISSGLSKWCGAGGWRLGTFVFPKELNGLMEKMAEAASETFSCVSAPIQHASISAFEENDEIDRYLLHSRKILVSIAGFVQKSLSEVGLICPPSKGGFYLFPSFEPFRDKIESIGIHTGSELCSFLLNQLGIALLPGEAFGRSKEEFTVRLSYVDFDGKSALDFLENDGKITSNSTSIQTHFPKIYESVQLISAWVRHL